MISLSDSPGVIKRCALLFTCFLFFGAAGGQTNAPDIISRDLLKEDVQQLADLLETVHPDPYINGGGKVAFHRRLYTLLKNIPGAGMTREDFLRLLRPFVAAIGDSHTSLGIGLGTKNPAEFSGGIPLFFGIIEHSLFVYAAPGQYRELIGARLAAAADVSYEDIVKRASTLISHESELCLLMYLSRELMLWHYRSLQALIPEWSSRDRIRVTLKHPDGQVKEHVLQIPGKMTAPLHYAPSKIELPSREKSDFVYTFLDKERKTALLVIDIMTTYREIWELAVRPDMVSARKLYKRFRGEPVPDDDKTVIAGLPSAAELFQSLVVEMKQAGTENLLVDLRENPGGNSSMADYLIYYLFGQEIMISKDQLTSKVVKIFKKQGDSAVPVKEKYNFRQDFAHFGYPTEAGLAAALKHRVSRSPFLKREIESGAHAGYYRPKNIIVLASPYTFSSGYTMMRKLKQAGAILVGSTSAQAHKGPSFGNSVRFKFKNSGIPIYISKDNYYLSHIFAPDYELTYDKLAAYNFDRNAEILYALEVIKELEQDKK